MIWLKYNRDDFEWQNGSELAIKDRDFYANSLHNQYNRICGWIAAFAVLPVFLLLSNGLHPSYYILIYIAIFSLLIMYLQNRVIKLKKRINSGNFTWRTGRVDFARNGNKNHSKYVIADGAYCQTFESISKFHSKDEIMIIKLEKYGIAFVKNKVSPVE